MADDRSRAPQARTRLARRAVLDAARTLFLERGYGATTIDGISSASEIPQATVYRLFSSKKGILKALVDTSVAGDDEPVPVAERSHVRPLLDATRPEDSLARLAAISVDINTRTAPIYRILVSAASSDTDAAAILDELTRQRQEGQGRVATALARAKALRTGLRAAGRRRRHPRPRLSGALPPARHRPCVVSTAVRAMARGNTRRPTAPVDHTTHSHRNDRPAGNVEHERRASQFGRR